MGIFILLHFFPKIIRILFFFFLNPLPLILPSEIVCSFPCFLPRVHISACYYVDRFWNAAYHPTHGSRSEIARLCNSASFMFFFCFLPVFATPASVSACWDCLRGAADMQVASQEKNVPLSRFQSNNGLILYHSTFNHRNHRARPLNSSCSLSRENRGAQRQRDDSP